MVASLCTRLKPTGCAAVASRGSIAGRTCNRMCRYGCIPRLIHKGWRVQYRRLVPCQTGSAAVRLLQGAQAEAANPGVNPDQAEDDSFSQRASIHTMVFLAGLPNTGPGALHLPQVRREIADFSEPASRCGGGCDEWSSSLSRITSPASENGEERPSGQTQPAPRSDPAP